MQCDQDALDNAGGAELRAAGFVRAPFDFAGARLEYFGFELEGSAGAYPRQRVFTPGAIIQIEGSSRLKQLGRKCDLTPGSFSFVDASAPITVENGRGFRQLHLQFPKTTFSPREFHEIVAWEMDFSWRLDREFVDCTQGIWEAADKLHPLEHSAALSMLVSLGSLTSAFRHRADEMPIPVRVCRAMAFIEHNLGESWLTPQAVADAQKVSRRYLDELFAKNRSSIESWIWERRIARAAEELRIYSSLPGSARKSVLQIALDLGFKSPSHFSRSFASRFGVSPRAFKKQISPAC